MNENMQQFEKLLDSLSNEELFSIVKNFVTRDKIIVLINDTLSDGDKEDIKESYG